MNPKDLNPEDSNHLNNLYWSVDGEHYQPLDTTGGNVIQSELVFCTEPTEADEARLWALIEGLEIVPREDGK